MRPSKAFAAVLLVVVALAAASLACEGGDLVDLYLHPNDPSPSDLALTPVAWPMPPPPTEAMWGPMWATLYAPKGNSHQAPTNVMWESSSDQIANLYSDGYSPTTPFSQLFGNLDQAATIASMKAAIPDLKYSQRMVIQQNAWVASAFDLSGTFTQPLVTASGTLPPTNQPWFTTVHMIDHYNVDGKIDQEYSVTDMASMLHEAGVDGFQNMTVGKLAMEMPMTEEVPSDDPASDGIASAILAKLGGGPFSAWLPSGLPRNMPTTYHSPYGDAVGDVPEVESRLLGLRDAQVVVPLIIQQGNAFGIVYRYTAAGTYGSPIKFSNGKAVPPFDTRMEFYGIALGDVDATGHIQAWNMINRLDNPINPDQFGTAPGITTTQEVAPEVTPLSDDYGDEFMDNGDTTDTEPAPIDAVTATPPAGGLTATPAASGTTCTVTAPQKVNLRQGPGTSFAIGGTLPAGQTAEADGQAQDGNGRAWFHIGAMNLWARSDVVTGDCAALPEIAPG